MYKINSFLLIVLNLLTFSLLSQNNSTTLYSSEDDFYSVETVSWSPNGEMMVLLCSDSLNDKSMYLLNTNNFSKNKLDLPITNIDNPCFMNSSSKLVFNMIKNDSVRLYKYDLEGKYVDLLFNRKINAKEASFAPDDKLVVFSGFNVISNKWQIYTYDFIYDNLNQLTNTKRNCYNPVFSPDGKHILYETTNLSGDSLIKMINWYGNEELVIDSLNVFSPAWQGNNWRFAFIASSDSADADIFSVRITGESIYEIQFNDVDDLQIQFSPNQSLVSIIYLINSRKILLIKKAENF